MPMYNLVAENPESTVVVEYQSPLKRETSYQTEDQLEKAFIQLLQAQAYDYLKINSEAELVNNLRVQLQKLNNYTFSNNEWDLFFRSKIANPNSGIEEKTTLIQEDHIQILDCDDGTKKNIYLLDKTNIHNNQLQVINQYEVADGQRPNRYDVTILVNGLPLVHIELKKRGVDINQAERDLRMNKVRAKVLEEFRRLEPAQEFMRIRSLIGSAIKQDVCPLQTLEMVFTKGNSNYMKLVNPN